MFYKNCHMVNTCSPKKINIKNNVSKKKCAWNSNMKSLEIQTCRGIHCLHFALSAFSFFFCAHMYKLVLKCRNTQKYHIYFPKTCFFHLIYYNYLFMIRNIHTIIIYSHLHPWCNNIYLTNPLLDFLIVTVCSCWKEFFKGHFST